MKNRPNGPLEDDPPELKALIEIVEKAAARAVENLIIKEETDNDKQD